MSDNQATSSTSTLIVPAIQQLFQSSRQEYQDYLPLTERVQSDLREDAELLRAQEGWDEDTWLGVEEWVDDLGSIWRALRRNRYEEDKTHAFLLSALNQRVSLSLHNPIPPFPPYSDSSLFYILPLPHHTDKLSRPIAVLTVREVARDEEGGLGDMKEWTWWALEMVRRTLRDWWVRGGWDDSRLGRKGHSRGEGGEGLVLLVDAAGAGYRNLEVELLPTLLSVGHNNFPGMIEAVYVVNAGWTHRSMWGIVKRVLPRSALDKVAFLDTPQAIEEIFDLDHLPQAYGGTDPFTFDPQNNPILNHFFRHSSYDALSHAPSRSSSCSSIADLYYTARNNTPSSSRQGSHASNLSGLGIRLGHFGSGLRMTKSRDTALPPVKTSVSPVIEGKPETNTVVAPTLAVMEATPRSETQSLDEDGGMTTSGSSALSRQYSARRSGSSRSHSPSPLQRIRSLSDFHLYLSPSRLANIDLLSDSDPEDEEEEQRPPPPRRVLRPAILDKQPLAERRDRPPLRLLGVPRHLAQSDAVRTYSDQLQHHHAKVLEQYKTSPTLLGLEQKSAITDSQAENGDDELLNSTIISVEAAPRNAGDRNSPEGLIEPPTPEVEMHNHIATNGDSNPSQPITAYSSSNPWFGYPAIRHGSSIRPRYSRNRKRDLVKTLLFLFMLRLQSFRDSLERALGLNRLRSWSATHTQPHASITGSGGGGSGPSEGLLRSAIGSREMTVKNKWDRDWWWMIIGFLLLRGTWTRLVLAPIEALGLDGLKEMLGRLV
ncbi:hypothetical protein CI109_107347 [Kwoniella shandongensis]|uniref:Uncharacterized protein n=1 Tax=Kwoniella shandongensis TaxID=1734106 RepID=A0A5M6BVQ3_9TREE|nr:uncharacterized protein CI109_004725 [Kwoniella shandongensis]KAA5526948.1 hypothetical protein CI109_004725 [Kwoniella shandongensis]